MATEYVSWPCWTFNLRCAVIFQREKTNYSASLRGERRPWPRAKRPLISWTAFRSFSFFLRLSRFASCTSFLLAEHTRGTRGPRVGLEAKCGVKGEVERQCEQMECELWGEWIGSGFLYGILCCTGWWGSGGLKREKLLMVTLSGAFPVHIEHIGFIGVKVHLRPPAPKNKGSPPTTRWARLSLLSGGSGVWGVGG